MQAWELDFHRRKRRHDLLCIAQFCISILIFVKKLKQEMTGINISFAALCLSTTAMVAVLSLCSPPWYLKHRSAIMVFYKTSTVIGWITCVFRTPAHDSLLPLAQPTTLAGRLRNLLAAPILAIQVMSCSHDAVFYIFYLLFI